MQTVGLEQWIPAALPRGIEAGATVRLGGVSKGVHAGLNLGLNTTDAPDDVAANRRMFASVLRETRHRVCWLTQLHGTGVVERGSANAAQAFKADAHWTTERDLVLAVLTADCLPVLFADEQASCIAAAHAGWRGLAAGVLEQTLTALPFSPERFRSWIGPAIGGNVYEVGEEVRDAFAGNDHWFHASRPRHWWFDMAGLAAEKLTALGVDVSVSGYCTYRDQRFYSYRRDGETGRQACFVRLLPGESIDG